MIARFHRRVPLWIQRLASRVLQYEVQRLKAYATALDIDRKRWQERALEAEGKARR